MRRKNCSIFCFLPRRLRPRCGSILSRDEDQALIVAKEEAEQADSTREKLRKLLREGALDDRYVELDVPDRNFPMIEIFAGAGMEEMDST